MAFNKEQVKKFHEQASEMIDLLTDAVDSAAEWMDTIDDKNADDDDKGLAEQNLEESLDILGNNLVSLEDLVGGLA